MGWPEKKRKKDRERERKREREKEKERKREKEKEKERKREKEFMVVVNVDTCKRGCAECFSFLTYLGQKDRQTDRRNEKSKTTK